MASWCRCWSPVRPHSGGYGEVRIGDDSRALRVTWDPAECAAVPMLHHRRVGSTHLTRLWFSLAEVDDTIRDGGTLLPFEMRIEPWEARRLLAS